MPVTAWETDVDRVRVVEDHGVRRDGIEVVEDGLHGDDGTERHHHPARTLGLLADHAVLHRDDFVLQPHLESTWPVARQHGIHICEPGALIRGGFHRDVEAKCARELAGDRLDQFEPVGPLIDQDDVGAVEFGSVGQEGRHRSGGAGRAAADVGDFDASDEITVSERRLDVS